MFNQKIDFSELEWETSPSNARSKTIIRGNKKIRLVELPKHLDHPDWCETGHVGLVLEGKLEIKFETDSIIYIKGDGILISEGCKEKHIPKPISNKVILFLTEDI